MSEDQLAEHLSAHADSCDDPRWFFGWCPVCRPLRRSYFEQALNTSAGGRFLDGRVVVAFVELPNDQIWAEVETVGAEAPEAVASFEQLHLSRDVHWFFDPRETCWLGRQEEAKHRPNED